MDIFFFLMGIMFCDSTVETAGAHREGLAVGEVIRCQEYYHLAVLKLYPTDTNKKIIKLLTCSIPVINHQLAQACRHGSTNTSTRKHTAVPDGSSQR